MEVGDNVVIKAFAFLESVSPTRDITLRIGAGTYVGHFSRITALSDVRIGKKVLISDRVYISDTGHDYEDTTKFVTDQNLRANRKVHIGDGAWIGIGAAIVGNVRIGRCAVVGANAVLTRDLPAHAVAAGNPARIIRHHDGQIWRPGPPAATEDDDRG